MARQNSGDRPTSRLIVPPEKTGVLLATMPTCSAVPCCAAPCCTQNLEELVLRVEDPSPFCNGSTGEDTGYPLVWFAEQLALHLDQDRPGANRDATASRPSFVHPLYGSNAPRRPRPAVKLVVDAGGDEVAGAEFLDRLEGVRSLTHLDFTARTGTAGTLGR